MKVKSLEDLFLFELRDIYHAEKQLVKALPKMAKAASSEDLRTCFETHLEETQGHVQRLEQVFTMMGMKAKGKSCEAMEGLIAEGKDILGTSAENSVKDAGLIAAANKVEHYEIAGYGTLVTWAQQLGRHDAANLLEETLHEEKNADQKLTHIAEGMVNLAAAHGH